MITPDRIREAARALHKQAIDIRRHLHRNPELSFEEEKTAAFIANQLRTAGIPCKTGVGGNGVVGLVEGTEDTGMKERRTIALRADIDALPIQERNTVEWRSGTDGVMHACGHDAHAASLIATGRLLQEARAEFRGTVKLIFQPAEEKAPGGASAMIAEGVLANPAVDCVVGQHVNPEVPAGKVGFRPGLFMGSVDDIYMTIRGKGGHAAKPHLCVDPVAIASNLIVTLQQVISRNADPTHPTVLTFGYIHGAGSNNIIPDTVELSGTMRTFNPVWRDEAVARIEKTSRELVASMGGTVDVRMARGYPSLTNDPHLTARARDHAVDYLGQENVVELAPALWGEDFAYYALERPGCFYNLGVGNENRGIVHPVHSPSFEIDERALETGPGLMAWIAIRELARD